jgi:hypothetical protein
VTDENASTFVEVYHAEKSKELSLALPVAKYGFEKLTEPEPGPDA